jgi:hypothetical protein
VRDMILSICTGVFAVSLIPQLVLVYRKKHADQISLATALMTSIFLWIMTFVFLSMQFWYTFVAELLQSVCWTLLLVAKIRFREAVGVSKQ